MTFRIIYFIRVRLFGNRGGKMFYANYANKEVLTVKGAEILGVANGIYINKTSKRAEALMVKTEEGERILPLKKISGNADKITVYSKDCFVENEQEKFFLLTKDTQAYNEDGILLGNFKDITVTGERLIWFDKPYPVRFISGFSDNTIVINLNLRLQKARSPEPKDKPPQPEQTVIDDYNFLLGRIVIRDIIDKPSNISIKKGTVINNSVLEQAKTGGKLVYLALSSLLD